jgi:glycine dehydrogenase subunit 1
LEKTISKMNFIPNTEKDKKEMMEVIGIKGINELFKDIPKKILLKQNLKIPNALSELELKKLMVNLSKQNKPHFVSFLGAGAYNHFIPSIVNHLVSRSEFYTAYTPYQPEISQGILQAVYEYQTMICELTGMDIANASMYDGASALAEAVIMATNITNKKEILISSTIHSEHRKVVKTYVEANSLKLIEIGFEDLTTSINDLKNKISNDTAAVLIQNPNFFGSIENLKEISDITHNNNALFIVSIVEPTSLGILKSPGSLGADIVVGEGQSLGTSQSYGGPYLGIMATKKEYMRQIPGRLVGQTKDAKGKRGFILTLQAREQHIRREKATSNICSNEALIALTATVYLAAFGKKLKELAEINIQKTNYAIEKLRENGFEVLNKKPVYNEFVLKLENSKKVNEELLKNNMIGGLELGKYYPLLKNCLLFCITEIINKEDIDKLVKVLKIIS